VLSLADVGLNLGAFVPHDPPDIIVLLVPDFSNVNGQLGVWIMKALGTAGVIILGILPCAFPISLHWSSVNLPVLSIDSADARIGRPLTPFSVAGVNRRVHRRAYFRATGYGYGRYGYARRGYGGYGYGGYGYSGHGYDPNYAAYSTSTYSGYSEAYPSSGYSGYYPPAAYETGGYQPAYGSGLYSPYAQGYYGSVIYVPYYLGYYSYVPGCGC
jgi:hypothetical protein